MPQRGRPLVNTLTDSQARILREVELFLREHSFSPTVRELAERLGMAGPSVNEQLHRLERNGFVKRQPNKARSLTVLRSAELQGASLSRLIAVPIVGTVAAGSPVFSPENICGEVLVEEAVVRSGSHFALKASGRSMIDAGCCTVCVICANAPCVVVVRGAASVGEMPYGVRMTRWYT